jgi:predicted RNase H-like nuclease
MIRLGCITVGEREERERGRTEKGRRKEDKMVDREDGEIETGEIEAEREADEFERGREIGGLDKKEALDGEAELGREEGLEREARFPELLVIIILKRCSILNNFMLKSSNKLRLILKFSSKL